MVLMIFPCIFPSLNTAMSIIFFIGLNKYFQTVITECQEKGYVTTLTQRRRYLPMITSQEKAKQAHAGRQAINTTIQGSAADIIKAAMIRIEKKLQQTFPGTSEPCSSLKSLSK